MVYCAVDGERITQIAVGFPEPPFTGAIAAPEEVLQEPNRWFWVDGAFKYYAKAQLPAIIQGSVNEIVEVRVILPEDTPDAEALFRVEDGEPIIEPVQDGETVHLFVFAQPGNYKVSVRTRHHGLAQTEVIVQ